MSSFPTMSSTTAPLPRSAAIVPAICRSPETIALRAAKPRSIRNLLSKARSSRTISSMAPQSAYPWSISTAAAVWEPAAAIWCATSRPRDPYPGTFGIGISVEADISVTGNVVENAPLYGIQLGWGAYMRNVIATGNIVRASGEGIYVSVVEGVGSAIICDNIIQDSKNGGIVGHSWSRCHGQGFDPEERARSTQTLILRAEYRQLISASVSASVGLMTP